MKGKKTGGRKAGVPNKISGQLKQMILGALDEAGGLEYLTEQAQKNPAAFMQLIGRVLPQVHEGEIGHFVARVPPVVASAEEWEKTYLPAPLKLPQ